MIKAYVVPYRNIHNFVALPIFLGGGGGGGGEGVMGRRAIFSVVDILLVNTDNKSYHSFIGDYIIMPECS